MSIFSQVPQTKISRSTHGVSHQVKASFNSGPLYPLMCELAYPGDSWRVRMEQFIRSMPMIAPVMDRIDVKVDAFFIPLRLIWDDFEDFISLGPTGEFTALRPTINIGSITPTTDYQTLILNSLFGVGGSADYLRFPTFMRPFVKNVSHVSEELDALPFRAYQLVYNEYYRNESIDPEIPVITSSGPSTLNLFTSTAPEYIVNFLLKNRGWRKDYFTSALPFPQKGPAVKIPYGDINIQSDGDPLVLRSISGAIVEPGTNTEDQPVLSVEHKSGVGGDGSRMEFQQYDDANNKYRYESGLEARLSSASLPTIEELRYAEVLQEYYEANARGGTRYKEYLQNIWHTKSRDSRLDRPEYLGGYRGPVTITDVDQNSASGTTPQGNLAGRGTSAGGAKLFRIKHCPEFGIILVLMSVQPKSAYYQGYRKWNLYNDVFDWPNPFFANLGEQEILNKEIYDDPTDSYNNGTFGYTPRYSEAKYIPDYVAGMFKTSLDYWHLGRKFATRPNLNTAFLHVDPQEVARIFPSQVSDDDKFVGTFFFHCKRRMYLPYWGVPRLIHSI